MAEKPLAGVGGEGGIQGDRSVLIGEISLKNRTLKKCRAWKHRVVLLEGTGQVDCLLPAHVPPTVHGLKISRMGFSYLDFAVWVCNIKKNHNKSSIRNGLVTAKKSYCEKGFKGLPRHHFNSTKNSEC